VYKRQGLEGLIGKQSDSPYLGERSRQWIKLKCRPRQEFVIGGYTDPRGSRAHFGALLLGAYEERGLRYVGRVGSGFDEGVLAHLGGRFAELKTSRPPFIDPPRERDVHWLKPELVAEIAFGGWTRENLLRQSSFMGLREDRPAAGIVREEAAPPEPPPDGAFATGSAEPRVGGVRLTHPDRLVWPESGIIKSDYARYCESVAAALLPHLRGRPLSLLRCPEGSAAACFFQKHLGRQRPAGVRSFAWEEASGERRDYVYVDGIDAVIGLVQRGIVEFHTWGSSMPNPERPDRITLDLDPAPELPWERVVEGAQFTRAVFEELGLACFLKTTGGKGLHVVAPIERRHDWPQVKAFAKAIAAHLAHVLSDRFTANMAKNRRTGKIFVDYLRNGEGATAIASYSARARPGAPVSVPLAWEELSPELDPAGFNLRTVPARVAALPDDPWRGYDGQARAITAKMRRALGMPG
jgi:bifunctional non-homologous end joining protein LigD